MLALEGHTFVVPLSQRGAFVASDPSHTLGEFARQLPQIAEWAVQDLATNMGFKTHGP